MQQPSTEYRIVKGSAGNDELEKYRLCFEKNGTERDMRNLQWLHHQNLLKQNSIYYAMQGDEIAGIYTALPVAFKINDAVFPALQSIDTLTDIGHRGKGLFIKLANRLYEEAPANNYVLIYGFPNDNSAPGFFKKLQWTSFGEAPFLLKPLNPFYFLKKLLNRKKHTDFSSTNHIFDAPATKQLGGDEVIRVISSFQRDYDKLWQLAAQHIKVCVNRSSSYMNWRYVDKPGEHYYRYGVYTKNVLTGIIVFSIKHKHDGRVGYIMELIFDPADNSTGKQLLKFATQLFRKEHTDVVLAWSLPGSFNYSAYRKSGYYVLPEKLRPQQLFVGARVFDAGKASLVADIKNWYLSYSDSDTA